MGTGSPGWRISIYSVLEHDPLSKEARDIAVMPDESHSAITNRINGSLTKVQ